MCNHNSREIWHSFSRTSMRNFLWCYYRWFITSSALEKCKKRMQNSLNYSGFYVFVHWKLKLLNFLVDSVFKLSVCQNFHIKTKENLPQNTEFPRTIARTAAGGLFAVCRVLFSFVVCKVRDVSQTPQMKPPASLRRLKNLLITNFVLFH